MGIRIQHSDWVALNGTLAMQVGYSGFAQGPSERTLQVHVDTSPNTVFGGIHKHISILIHPNPFDFDPGFAPVQLARIDRPIHAKIVTARCGPCDDGSLIVNPIDEDGTAAFLNTLNEGVMMRLAVFGDRGIAFQVPIPNDAQFRPAAAAFFSNAEGFPREHSMMVQAMKPRGFVSRMMARVFG